MAPGAEFDEKHVFQYNDNSGAGAWETQKKQRDIGWPERRIHYRITVKTFFRITRTWNSLQNRIENSYFGQGSDIKGSLDLNSTKIIFSYDDNSVAGAWKFTKQKNILYCQNVEFVIEPW